MAGKGGLVTLVNTLKDHTHPVCDIHSLHDGRLASSDDSGKIVLWDSASDFQKMRAIEGYGYDGNTFLSHLFDLLCYRIPCTSVCLWNNLVVGGYGSGHIRIFSAATGKMTAEIAAHARWIHAIDVAPDTGLVLDLLDNR